MEARGPMLVGAFLALVSAALGRLARFDRDRALYPVVLIVIASYYILFAAMGGTPRAVQIESIAATFFTVAAILGFRFTLWWVVVALAGHGVFDWVHHQVIANPGVPEWWPAFCLTFDVVFAGALAALLLGRDIRARHVRPRPSGASAAP